MERLPRVIADEPEPDNMIISQIYPSEVFGNVDASQLLGHVDPEAHQQRNAVLFAPRA